MFAATISSKSAVHETWGTEGDNLNPRQGRMGHLFTLRCCSTFHLGSEFSLSVTMFDSGVGYADMMLACGILVHFQGVHPNGRVEPLPRMAEALRIDGAG